jgi:hypothetical protein
MHSMLCGSILAGQRHHGITEHTQLSSASGSRATDRASTQADQASTQADQAKEKEKESKVKLHVPSRGDFNMHDLMI